MPTISTTGGLVVHPEKEKSFSAATTTVQSWYTTAVENVGPEARRVEMLGGHTRVSKSVDNGEVEVEELRKARTWVDTWN